MIRAYRVPHSLQGWVRFCLSTGSFDVRASLVKRGRSSYVPILGRACQCLWLVQFRGFTLQLPSAVCVRLRLPLRPVHPRLIARLLWRHGTAQCRGICEQRRKSHAVCKICHSER
ncbi:DUF1472 domain-containing protein [Escherichia coli]|nr:DUF1472 domain-containing protein [Escherichia coli]EGJ7459628.1 DUF1472 domain-containing protein [Escherichia coli]